MCIDQYVYILPKYIVLIKTMDSTAIYLTRGFKMFASFIDFSISFFKTHLKIRMANFISTFCNIFSVLKSFIFLDNTENKLKFDVNSTLSNSFYRII